MPKNTESVKLNRPTLIKGEWTDKADVYPFQKRHLVDAGYVSGSYEDIASEGEKKAGALNVLKKAEDRDDLDGGVWSVDRAYAENDEQPARKGK